jgi:hypothetical protein
MRRAGMIGLAVVGLSLGVLIGGLAWAGSACNLECLNAKCGYKGKCELGGGFAFNSLDGYCVSCGEWVRITWDRKTGKAPTPLGQVWVAETGKTMPLYPCPSCKGPFLPVTVNDRVKDPKYTRDPKWPWDEWFMHCPKCGEPSLRVRVTVNAD